MARTESENLQDPELIFITGKLRTAQRVEEVLTGLGVSYAVQVEPFGRSFLFGRVRMGAAFYVTSEQAVYCRERLAAAGLDGVVGAQE